MCPLYEHFVCVCVCVKFDEVRVELHVKRAELQTDADEISRTGFVRPHVPNSINPHKLFRKWNLQTGSYHDLLSTQRTLPLGPSSPDIKQSRWSFEMSCALEACWCERNHVRCEITRPTASGGWRLRARSLPNGAIWQVLFLWQNLCRKYFMFGVTGLAPDLLSPANSYIFLTICVGNKHSVLKR
jgi:hypothetical protein